jgi:ectoine hydroxylase-related dioxygenase (phytanoyl-CoA dioxygenase family)
MPNYHKTYNDLCKELVLFEDLLNTVSIKEKKYEVLKNIYYSSDAHFIKFIIACVYFNIDYYDGTIFFSSNRYLTDVIKTEILPSKLEINNFLEYNIKNLGVNKNQLLCCINELLTKFKENDIKNKISLEELNFLNKNGYLILHNVLDKNLCDELYSATLEMSNFYKYHLKKGYVYGSGNLERIYSLISKNQKYHELLLNPMVHEIMSNMFYRESFHEKYYLTSFHANILRSGAEEQIWHIDANVPEPIPPWIIRSNSNFILHDYTERNGATEIIPGSHLWLKKPSKADVKNNFNNSIKLIAPKGSIIIWHGHLWHRSGLNNTNEPRIAILGAYSASFFREVCMEENPYLNLNSNQVALLSDEMKNLLGWNHGGKNYYF